MGAGQGAGLRRLVGVRQTPAKPVMPARPGPGTPGSLRTVQDEEGSVYGAPAAGAARGSIALAPGQLTSNFPPTTELAQALHCKRSLRSGRRLCRGLCLPFRFSRGLRRWEGSLEYGAVATDPGRSQSRRLLGGRPAAPALGATWPVSSRRSSGLCPYLCRGQDSGCQPAGSRSRRRLRRPVASRG